jgi:hypothetical protein
MPKARPTKTDMPAAESAWPMTKTGTMPGPVPETTWPMPKAARPMPQTARPVARTMA